MSHPESFYAVTNWPECALPKRMKDTMGVIFTACDISAFTVLFQDYRRTVPRS